MGDSLLDGFHPDPESFKDKAVLVTGAAGGIGRAVAARFAAVGSNVILLDKRELALNDVYDELLRLETRPVLIATDLGRFGASDAGAIAGQIEQEFGALKAIIHCAADESPLTPFAHLGEDDLARAFSINVVAPFLLTRACLPSLERDGAASAIFTSLEASEKGLAYWGIQGVTGAGIDSLVRIWADELETNYATRLFSIDPGPVFTPGRTRNYPVIDPETTREPSEVAEYYLALVAGHFGTPSGTRIVLPSP